MRVLRRSVGVLFAAMVMVLSTILPASPGMAEDTVYASDFGFDPIDATTALQSALDSTASTVVVDNVGQDWITRPLFIRRSNVRIVFENGVVVKAKEGYVGSDSLISATRLSNVSLVGYGATLRMNKPEYTTGEFRMALKFYSMTDLRIEGLSIRDSGGDGIYLGDAGGAQPYNLRVTIKDVQLDNHRRNGLSVISVDGLVVDNVAVTNTNGTAPEFGIDLEPNNAGERLANISFNNVRLSGNVGGCILFTTYRFTASSYPVSFDATDVTCDSPGDAAAAKPRYGAIVVYGSALDDIGPAGHVRFSDSVIRPSGHSGCVAIYRKPAAGYRVGLSNVACESMRNPFTTLPYPQYPITFHGSNLTTAYGGVDFDNVMVTTDIDQPILGVMEQPTSPGLSDLSGRITAVNPHGVRVNLGAHPTNINLLVNGNPV